MLKIKYSKRRSKYRNPICVFDLKYPDIAISAVDDKKNKRQENIFEHKDKRRWLKKFET